MIMRTVIPMATDTGDLMRLGQWLSPAFPVSSYAYSHGLEAEIAGGRVTEERALEAWLATILQAGAGRSDAILLSAARDPARDIDTVSDMARALAGSRERLEETEAQGAALSATLASLGHGDGIARPYPVALGLAARALSLPAETVAALYLQAFVGNLVSVAVRFMPLGQAAGQAVLARLAPTIAAVAAEASSAGLDGIGQGAFAADLAAMEHETLDVRIYRT